MVLGGEDVILVVKIRFGGVLGRGFVPVVQLQ